MTKAPMRRPAKGPRVAIAQIEPILGDVGANLEKHRDAVARAVDEQVDLLVFPELSLTGYRLKDTVPDVAVRSGGEVFEELAAMSEQTSLVVGLVAETDAHKFYNSAAYFEAGKLLAVHHKAYLPTYGMFDEQRYFAHGDKIRAFDTEHGRTGMLICEDMLHPSAVMIATLDGAAVVIAPSASPVKGVLSDEGSDAPAADGDDADPTDSQLDGDSPVDANGRSWEAYNRVTARSFGIFVVYANRVGVEDGQTFWGGSEIIAPDGSTLAKAAYYEPDFISATLPHDALRSRRIQAPVMRDENVDLTINELCRIRDRSEPARPSFGRDDRGGDDRRGRDFGRGGDDRRGRDFGRGGDDRRGRDFGRGGDDRRGRDFGRGGDDRGGRDFGRGRDDRSDHRFSSNDRGGPPRDDRRDERRDERRDDTPQRDAPTRGRPDRRAQKPRPVGRGPRRRDDTDGS